MNKIQLILTASSILLYFAYLRLFRTALLDRLLALGALVVTVIALSLPDFVSSIAGILNVGRGADLVFYLFFFASIFIWVVMHSRIAKLREQVTDLSRYFAIAEASRSQQAKVHSIEPKS